MSLLKDIPELINAGIITPETADSIRNYYQHKRGPSTNRLFTVFGILGALLVGLGIILIIAHNWDELSRGAKTFFAFLPLFTGQALCGYILLKTQHSVAWRESGATFLYCAVGAAIALVGQIYNIPGGTGPFLFTWMLLCLPVIYLMRSSVTSLLYIAGITYYATHEGYWSYTSSNAYPYWLMLLGVLPYYYRLCRKTPESNFTIFHNWAVPLSVVIALGTVAESMGTIMYVAYVSLFGLFYLVGSLPFFLRQKPKNSGYKLFGVLGTLVLLLSLSFDWFWKSLRTKSFPFNEVIAAPEFLTSAVLTLAAGALLLWHLKNKTPGNLIPMAVLFILFIATFIAGLFSPVAVVLINLYVFATGILAVREGARQHHLGILNYGLLIIVALVACRFFDADLSFVVRGILFVSAGIGFFAVNYWMFKKTRTNEQ